MKRVDIISKVVGRDSSGKPVGGGISIPMGNYALKSELESLKSMFNDFLEGDDTDSVINRWKDLEAFLNGISEEDPLTSILGNYVPIRGTTEIVGEKNFVGGLKVNGSPIYYDKTNKYWKLEGDLLITGGVTMYGTDSDFVPSTIMDAISVDGTTISKDGGVLKVIGSVGGATTLGSLTNVGSWADSVASQDRIMYQAANSSQWVAKNLSDLAVGGVTGNYLPLSGGTLTSATSNVLTINSSYVENGNYYSRYNVQHNGANKALFGWNSSQGTVMYNYTGNVTIGIKDDGTPHVNGSTIWHAGNDGSGSGLDADLLDGQHENAFCRQYDGVPITSCRGFGYGLSENGWIVNGPAISVGYSGETYLLQLQAPADHTNLYFRNKVNNKFSDWHQIAFTDSNVASATKLQTARTIWGQSFDGTGNVTNDLYLPNHKFIWGTKTDGTTKLGLMSLNSSNLLVIGTDTAANGIDTYISGNNINFRYSTSTVVGMTLTSTGNVGIGTTTPAYKMDIVGNSRTEYIYFWNKDWNGNAGYIGRGSTSVDRIILYAGNDDVYIYSKGVISTIFTGADMLVQGGITMYSARKLKNIQDERGLSLEELSVIKPTRFTWKDGRDNRLHIGGIADDVMKVLPEVIYKTGEDDTLTMDYGNAAFAIAASLIKPVVNHEERIKMLEEENKRLNEEIEQLKWNIA